MTARHLLAPVTTLALLATLLVPAAALADDELPAAGVLGNATLTIDHASLTSFQVSAPCRAQDERPSTNCTGEIRVGYTSENGGKRQHVGAAKIDVPVGQKAAVTITSTKVLDFLVKANLHGKLEAAQVTASFAYTDPGADIVNDVDITPKYTLVRRSFANAYTCGLPRTVKVTAKEAPTQILETLVGTREYVDRRPLEGTKLDTIYLYRANAPTTLKLNGLTYTFTKGTEFHLRCMGIGPVSNRLKRFPVAFVERGEVSVKGKPTGRVQINSGVNTPSGMFSADSRAAVNFTVKSVRPKKAKNARAIHSTLRSRRGTLTARQVFKIAPSARCTPGRAIRMYIDGRTVPVR